ncbi:retrovirus-related pol polyprotein from transposon TNT 1-94, partial [Tanacetum coccineum]
IYDPTERTKAFRLYDPIEKKVTVSRVVYVNEEITWDWSNECLYDPHNNTEHDAREVSIPTAMNNEDITFEEAIRNKKRKEAMDEEIGAIEKNKTWEMVELPKGHKPIGVKWVYKKKMNATGDIQRYKARLVAKGYLQKAGVDYDEIFALVARMETIRLLISQAAQNGWKIYQMDVKFASLNSVLDEVVYIEQPPGYMKVGEETKVLKLQKALYGLKQAPRSWNTRIDSFLKRIGYIQCPYEHAIYIKLVENKVLVAALYVDDLIFTGNNKRMIDQFKESMTREFDMTDMGLMKYFRTGSKAGNF